MLSLVLALGLAVLALPWVNEYVNGNLSLQSRELPALLVIAVSVGVLAGSYPALFLSSFRPISVLKSVRRNHGSHAYVRRGLVVVQFAISIGLIVATLVVYRQTEHLRTADLGFNQDALLVLPVNAGRKYQNYPIRRRPEVSG